MAQSAVSFAGFSVNLPRIQPRANKRARARCAPFANDGPLRKALNRKRESHRREARRCDVRFADCGWRDTSLRHTQWPGGVRRGCVRGPQSTRFSSNDIRVHNEWRATRGPTARRPMAYRGWHNYKKQARARVFKSKRARDSEIENLSARLTNSKVPKRHFANIANIGLLRHKTPGMPAPPFSPTNSADATVDRLIGYYFLINGRPSL